MGLLTEAWIELLPEDVYGLDDLAMVEAVEGALMAFDGLSYARAEKAQMLLNVAIKQRAVLSPQTRS